MIEHIVLFRWLPEATDEQISACLDGLSGLKERIPGILDLNCGVDFSGRSQGYTHALVVRFTDPEALDVYGPHPDHQAVIDTRIRPIVSDVLAFDFEITP